MIGPRWRSGVLPLAGALVLAAFPSGVRGQEPSAVDPIGWLAGCWEGTLSNGAMYEEVWLVPIGGVMLGTSRMTRHGRFMGFEFLRIVDDHGTPVYLAQPSGRPATSFPAVEVTETSAVFENPDHDFPQRILYRLTPPAMVLARIEGVRYGQESALDFPLSRVACPG